MNIIRWNFKEYSSAWIQAALWRSFSFEVPPTHLPPVQRSPACHPDGHDEGDHVGDHNDDILAKVTSWWLWRLPPETWASVSSSSQHLALLSDFPCIGRWLLTIMNWDNDYCHVDNHNDGDYNPTFFLARNAVLIFGFFEAPTKQCFKNVKVSKRIDFSVFDSNSLFPHFERRQPLAKKIISCSGINKRKMPMINVGFFVP